LLGVTKYRVAFPRAVDPYSEATLNATIERLLAAIKPVRRWG
jgi:hypothetical protein